MIKFMEKHFKLVLALDAILLPVLVLLYLNQNRIVDWFNHH